MTAADLDHAWRSAETADALARQHHWAVSGQWTSNQICHVIDRNHQFVELLFRRNPDTGYYRWVKGFVHDDNGGGRVIRTWREAAKLIRRRPKRGGVK